MKCIQTEKEGVEITINLSQNALDKLPRGGFAFECPNCKTMNSEGEALVFIGYFNRTTSGHPDFGTMYGWDDLVVCHKCFTVYLIHDGCP